MAGYYDDVPGHRMALDRDGTQMFNINSVKSSITQLTDAQVRSANDEASTTQTYGVSDGTQYIAVIFPELRDITAFFTVARTGNQDGNTIGTAAVESSADTTNGIDGTWATISTPTVPTATSTVWRTGIVSASSAGCKALRFRYNGISFSHLFLETIHVYGTLTAGENPDRLTLWHPTSDERVGAAYFDWGDVGRGSTGDRTFRVKNQSATLSADTITVSVDGLAAPTPSVSGAHTLSNGGAFAATTSAGTLAAGAISDVLTLRRALAANAVLSVWTFRVNAVAASWT